MSMNNYSFQLDDIATLRPESTKQTAKNASDNFTMLLTTLFHTLSSVSHILQDEYEMVSAIEKMWKAKISPREFTSYTTTKILSTLSFNSLLSLANISSVSENEHLLGPNESPHRKRYWVAIKNRNKSKTSEVIISEFDACAQLSSKLNLLVYAADRIEPTFIYEICQTMLTELAAKLTSKTVGSDPIAINQRIRKHLFYRSFQIILFAGRCGGVTEEQADHLFQLHSNLISNTANAVNADEFASIFQQIETKTMIQVFRSQNSEEISTDNLAASRGANLLPSALVIVVNEYCCLNPLSSADAAAITTNLLK